MSILTALGMKQFSQYLPPNYILYNRSLIVSHLEPFGARLDIEVIQAPAPVAAQRPARYLPGNATTYVHFVLNQRTIPLGVNYPGYCEERDDGWCVMSDFLSATAGAYNASQYATACFGNYTGSYGTFMNGNPTPGNATA